MSSYFNKLLQKQTPMPDEIFMGYIIRLTEDNCCYDPKWIMSMAGITEGYWISEEVFKGDVDLSILCQMTGMTLQSLEGLLIPPIMGDSRNNRLFDQIIPRDVIMHKNPRVCPLCLKERGYCHKLWNILPVTCCPYHSIMLMDICPGCGKRITWSRTKVCICECGKDWKKIKLPQLKNADLALSSQIYELCGFKSDKAAFKYPLLEHLNLKELLTIITYFARIISLLKKSKKNITPNWPTVNVHSIFKESISIFDNWPNNYFKFLDFVQSNPQRKQSAGIDRDFGSLYLTLYKKFSSEKYFFLTEAFEEYLHKHWTGGYLGTLKRIELDYTKQTYISQNQTAKELNISFRRLAKLIAQGQLKAVIKNRGKNRILLISKESIDSYKKSLGHHISNYETQKRLGIGESTFKKLIKNKYIVPVRGPTVDGFPFWLFRPEEISLFQENFGRHAIKKEIHGNDAIMTISDILSKMLIRYAIDMKTVIQGILDGKLIPYLCEQNFGLDKYIFLESDVIYFLNLTVTEKKSTYFNFREVASKLDISYDDVRFLINSGIIEADMTTVRGGKAVSRFSLEKFNEKYISSKCLVKAYKVKQKTLIDKLCSLNIIPVAVLKVKVGYHYIFLKADLEGINLASLKPKKRIKLKTLNVSQAAVYLGLTLEQVMINVTNGRLKPYSTPNDTKVKGNGYYFTRVGLEQFKRRFLNQEPIISAVEAAKLLGKKYAETFLREYVSTGRLRTIDYKEKGGKYFFLLSEVEKIRKDTVKCSEAAIILGVHTVTVKKWIRKGRLSPITGPSVDGFGHYLFLRSDVEKLKTR
jgi:predicted site-specific integrase-resolvase